MKEVSENKCYQIQQKDIQWSSQSLGRTEKQLKKEVKGGELIFKISVVTYGWENTGTLQNHSAV